MHIIYLAGNDLSNKTWIEEIKSKFDSFSTGEILYYDHWQNGEKWINLRKELEKLVNFVKDKNDYSIFSKSIGSILALKNIYEKKLFPQKMIICGFPYRAGKREFPEIDNCLKTLKIPTIFIQNEFDPVYSYEELETILNNNSPSNYRLINNIGNNTHEYLDYKNLSKIAMQFLK